MDVDHVITGTGFHVDVAGLPFLPQNLLARISSAKGYPVLSRAGESAVPGLYFAGALAEAAGAIREVYRRHAQCRGCARQGGGPACPGRRGAVGGRPARHGEQPTAITGLR